MSGGWGNPLFILETVLRKPVLAQEIFTRLTLRQFVLLQYDNFLLLFVYKQ